MRAVLFDAYGPPEVLRLDEAPDPSPCAGEVLVRIATAGVNPLDWKLRSGAARAFIPLSLPAILGLDFYGTVEDPNGSNFEVGARVIGLTTLGRFGGYAEAIAVSAAALARVPVGLAPDIAAALPTIGLTARATVAALAPGARQRPTVLVLGAAGCVATLARQLAARAGADEIAAVARAHQFDGLIGPAHVRIAAEAPDFTPLGRSVDLVIDTIGGPLQAAAMRTLAPGGRLVSTVQPADARLAAELGVTAAIVTVQADGAALSEIAGLVTAGELELPPITSFSLADAAAAHAAGERGGYAKAVLRVEEQLMADTA